MRKKWWWLRLVLLSFAAVALGWYLFHSTPWRKALGIQPSYAAQMAEGDGVVRAIYTYQEKTGLWPQYLEDACPQPLQFRWFYEVQALSNGRRVPALSTPAPLEGARSHLAYAFGADAAHGDWHVFSGGTDRIERAGPPVADPHAGSTPALQPARTLMELDRRIAREPDILQHRQDKISYLVLNNRLPEARQALADAAAQFPDSAWPRLAAAVLDLPNGGTRASTTAARPASLEAFAQFVAAKPSFTRFFDLSWLYRRWGDDDAAADAAAGALQLPLEVDADDTHVAAFYLWDMARWALARERWELAVAICDAWEKAREAGAVHDESFFALRGAAELALRKYDAAQTDLARSTNADPAWIHAADASVQKLDAAAAQKDATARLTFPPTTGDHPYPGTFAVFVAPQ